MLDHDPLLDVMIEAGGDWTVRVDVLADGVPVRTGIPVESGSVRPDRGRFTRRECTLVVADETLIPSSPADPLQPWGGSELRVWGGYKLPDRRLGLVPLGTFVIWDVQVAEPFGGVEIRGYDRCKLIEEARFLYPRVVGAGSLQSRLQALAVEAVPWADFAVEGVADATAGGGTYDRDRAQACRDIAAALGAEFYADPWGSFRLVPIPNPDGEEAWTISASKTLIGGSRGTSRDGVYNAVVVSSSTAGVDVPVTAVATDDDPWSPTYFHGASQSTGRTFGQVPRFFDTPLVTTVEQAQAAADGMLRDVIGVRQSVSVTTVVNPALEPGDVIAVEFSDGTRVRHLAESWEIDLEVGDGMNIETRSTAYDPAGS